MHTIVNPKQTNLFDAFDNVLTEKTRKRLLDGWPDVYHARNDEFFPVQLFFLLTTYNPSYMPFIGHKVLDS